MICILCPLGATSRLVPSREKMQPRREHRWFSCKRTNRRSDAFVARRRKIAKRRAKKFIQRSEVGGTKICQSRHLVRSVESTQQITELHARQRYQMTFVAECWSRLVPRDYTVVSTSVRVGFLILPTKLAILTRRRPWRWLIDRYPDTVLQLMVIGGPFACFWENDVQKAWRDSRQPRPSLLLPL